MKTLQQVGRQNQTLVTLSVFIAGACIARLYYFPSNLGDANAYKIYAQAIMKDGWLADIGSVRTFGYPLFLSMFAWLLPANEAAFYAAAGAVQYLMYLVAVIALSRELTLRNAALGNAVAIGLLANPYVISLATDTLSESMTIVLVTTLFHSLLRLERSPADRLHFYYLLGTGIAAALMTVRPSNLTFLIAWHVSAAIILARLHPTRCVLAAMLCGGVVTCMVIFPQVAYNYATWGKLSAFPVCQISDIQNSYAIAGLRYDGHVVDGLLTARTYVNPFFDGVQFDSPAQWHAAHVAGSVGTAIGHLLLAFSVNHLFTYVYGGDPWYSHLLSVSYWSLFVLGACSAIDMMRPFAVSSFRRPAVVFLLIVMLATVAILATTGVELRFNIASIAILPVFAVYGLRFRPRPRFALFMLGILIVATSLAEVMLADNEPGYAKSITVKITENDCFVFASLSKNALRFLKD